MKPISLFKVLLLFALVSGFSLNLVAPTSSASIQSAAYDIVDSHLEYHARGKSKSVDTFRFYNGVFTSSDALDVTITPKGNANYSYDLVCGNQAITIALQQGSSMFKSRFTNYMDYITHLTAGIHSWISLYGKFESTIFVDGLSLDYFPFQFAPNETSWDYLADWGANFSFRFYYNAPSSYTVNHNSSYEEVENVAILETFLSYTIDDSETGFAYSANNGFLIAVNKTDGVVLGYKARGILQGTYDGVNTGTSFILTVEQQGYDLPDYQYQFDFTLNIGFRILFSTSVVILPLLRVYLKRRRKFKASN